MEGKKNLIRMVIMIVGCFLSMVPVGTANAAVTVDLSLSPTVVTGIQGVYGDPVVLSGTVTDPNVPYIAVVYVDGNPIIEYDDAQWGYPCQQYTMGLTNWSTWATTVPVNYEIKTKGFAVGTHIVTMRLNSVWGRPSGWCPSDGVLVTVGSFTITGPDLSLSPTVVTGIQGVYGDPVVLSGTVTDLTNIPYLAVVYVDGNPIIDFDYEALLGIPCLQFTIDFGNTGVQAPTVPVDYEIDTKGYAVGTHIVTMKLSSMWNHPACPSDGVLFTVGSFTITGPDLSLSPTEVEIGEPVILSGTVTDLTNIPYLAVVYVDGNPIIDFDYEALLGIPCLQFTIDFGNTGVQAPTVPINYVIDTEGLCGTHIVTMKLSSMWNHPACPRDGVLFTVGSFTVLKSDIDENAIDALCAELGEIIDKEIPPVRNAYKNHGQYVSKVAHLADVLVAAECLIDADAEELHSCLVSTRAKSDVGKK